jgi:D-glycero-D-manno-heptose 1,7-bisphosphate phosphatase
MSKRAVFLDRDGTIMADAHYLSDPAGVTLLDGAADGLRRLDRAGYLLVVVTNQSGIARGLFTEETLAEIHAELARQLAGQGVGIDAIYSCPYHVEGVVAQYTRDSDLRKPNPGMILLAAEEMDIDLMGSWMIGDGSCDIAAGNRAGCRTVRLPSQGLSPDGETVEADYHARDLVEAAEIILDANRD